MTGNTKRAVLAVTLLCAAFTLVPSAGAQTDQERAGARAAAKDGIEAFNEGKFEEALRLLERAEAVVHAPTHLLFIARSRVQVGKLVEAREAYQKVINENLDPSANKAFFAAQETAREEIAQLDGRVARLTINVEGPQGHEFVELVVKIDGQLVSNALIGLSMPANPGDREVTASARGMVPVSEKVKLAEGGKGSIKLTLIADGQAAAVPPTAGDGAPEDEADAADEREKYAEKPPQTASGKKRNQSTIGWISTGVGAGFIAGGAVMGILSSSQLDRARSDDALCSDNSCTPDGYNEVDSARIKALVADISMGVGIAAVGAGIYLLATAPSARGESAMRKRRVGVRSIVPSADKSGGYLTIQGGF